MNNMLDMFSDMMGDDQTQTMGKSLGLDAGTAKQAMGAALPFLIKGLAQNARSQSGAESLSRALDRHDGGILDNVGDLLGGSQSVRDDGDKILGHIFGDRLGGVEQSVSKLGGVDSSTVAKLLPMLAPLVMGMLGKAKRDNGLGVPDLMDMLRGEEQRVERRAPQAGSLLGSLLDRDGDGQVADDVLDMGASLLKGLFK